MERQPGTVAGAAGWLACHLEIALETARKEAS